MTTRLTRASIALLAGSTIALGGCSSSGGSPPSQDKIVAKLKSDSAVKTQLGAAVGSNTKALNILYTCIAKVLHNDAPADEVNDYVKGKKTLEEVGQTKSDSKLKSDLVNCAKSKAK